MSWRRSYDDQHDGDSGEFIPLVKSGNAMASDQISLGRAWNVKQKLGARLRAIGYTQQSTADQVGVSITTIQKWEEDDAFHEYVQQLHNVAWQRIEPAIMANVALAVDVQRDMLNGLVKPDDKRYLEARRLIDRIVDRLLYVEPPALPAGDTAPTTAVNIQLNAGTGSTKPAA